MNSINGGRILILLGVLIMFGAVLADKIGVGQDPDAFGWVQMLGLAAGVIIALWGRRIIRRFTQ